MSSVAFDVPWPAPELWQNRKAHHMAHARVYSAAKQDAKYLALAAGVAGIRGHPAYRLDVTFHPSLASRADRHNLPATQKAAIDGIAAALQVDDRIFDVQWHHKDRSGNRSYVRYEVSLK